MPPTSAYTHVPYMRAHVRRSSQLVGRAVAVLIFFTEVEYLLQIHYGPTVCQWLDTVCGTDAVPSYEINPTTVDCLWKLMKRNQKQEKVISFVIDDLRQKAAEYSMEATRIGNVLSNIGLSCGSLSKSGTASLSTLVNMALVLHTKDASDTSLMLAISELYLTRFRQSESQSLEEKVLSELLAKTKTAFLKDSMLKKTLQGLDDDARQQDPEIEKKAKQAAFLRAKSKEYRKVINQLQEKLKSSGVDSTLYHSTLLRRSEELQTSRDKLHSLRAKLDSYQSLPPDLALAKVKVEEARRELVSIFGQDPVYGGGLL
ncbi:hypothetical protein LSH36_2191g00002 [Paralvinella palmiformis]|uniref:HAUS augmin-like complex subunit 1 n=1 Tax=Paralvinella palmiformis TaxID=53620 RepID=A0AAD9IRZ4_9ANNE|nr:hypothetical protein LSH36_2191g00002 [Paralvinella palmiformis]